MACRRMARWEDNNKSMNVVNLHKQMKTKH